MMILVKVLFWLLIFLIAIFLVLLFVPIKYVIDGQWHNTSGKLNVDINILCIRINSMLNKNRINKKDKKEEQKKEKEKRDKNFKDILLFLDKNFLSRVLLALKEILGNILPERYEISGTLGFSDPYYTGLLAAVRAVIPQIEIDPDFTREIYDIKLFIMGKVVLVKIIYIGIKAILSREFRPVLKAFIISKKNNKKRKKYATT